MFTDYGYSPPISCSFTTGLVLLSAFFRWYCADPVLQGNEANFDRRAAVCARAVYFFAALSVCCWADLHDVPYLHVRGNVPRLWVEEPLPEKPVEHAVLPKEEEITVYEIKWMNRSVKEKFKRVDVINLNLNLI